MPESDDLVGINVSTIVSQRTKEGRVCVKWLSLDEQLSVAETRALAHNLLHAAEAAETDALLLKVFTENLDMDANTAATMLHLFRNARAEWGQYPKE